MNLKHYEVTEHEDMRYTFVTSGGTHYELRFISISMLGDLPVYAFNIERCEEGQHSNGDDQMVRNTVAHVISGFFDAIDNAILSTCDIEDGRQNCRKRLFDRWLRQLNDGTLLIREAEVDTGVGLTWATMYYHRDNMFRTLLERSFDEMVSD